MPHKPFVRTLRAKWLGQRLREMREDQGMTLKNVGTELRRDHTALSRYERAEWPIRRHELITLLDLYGVRRADERGQLLQLAEDVWRADRWVDDFGDIMDSSFIDFPWLESRAEVIRSYHAGVIPGLFQIREYAELVIRSVEGPQAPETRISRGVELRMERQQILADPEGPRIGTIIDESALRRRIGGGALMRAQLDHVGQISQRPNVEIRVLPAEVALHAGLDGSFWLFQMPAGYPLVAYLESPAGSVYVDSTTANKFIDAYHRMKAAALDLDESAKLIASIAGELRPTPSRVHV